MNGITIFEFDLLIAEGSTVSRVERPSDLHCIPENVYLWLEDQCLRSAAMAEAAWLRLAQRRGRRVVQVTSYVGVIRAPSGYQIEVLPKVGRAMDGGAETARRLLIEMLRCLPEFRHIQTDSAQVLAARMPLFEVFVAAFLRSVDLIVKSGLRGDYSGRRGNLFALRGKLLIATHLRHNLVRADRFFTEHDEFSNDRPENRLLHAALRRVLTLSTSQSSQQLARELQFVFFGVPASTQPQIDFKRVRLDRSMRFYDDALAWARLILQDDSPLTGAGGHHAPSLLFPMETIFECFVAKHLARQLAQPFTLKTQARSRSLVTHLGQDWFRLKPDLLVQASGANRLVLDTKWKLLESRRATSAEKYGLDQHDFYQLHAYGQNYLDGKGDVVLIYPRTDAFNEALPVFGFPKSAGLRLWVLPLCLKSKQLLLPPCGSLDALLIRRNSALAT